MFFNVYNKGIAHALRSLDASAFKIKLLIFTIVLLGTAADFSPNSVRYKTNDLTPLCTPRPPSCSDPKNCPCKYPNV